MFQRIKIRKHEWYAICVSFVYFFCLLTSYYIVRPVRDQLSAAVGSTALPIFYLATLLVTLALLPVFGAIVKRYPRRRFMPAVYLFFIAGMLVFIPLFQMQDVIGARVLGSMFFVWISVFNLFVVAAFWSYMADIFDPEQAHRLFPVIAVGGTLGAITGPSLTKALVYKVGTAGLLGISALLLGFCIVAIALLARWARRNPVAGDSNRDERIIGGGVFAGAVQTLTSPFLRRVAALMLLGDCVGTVVYALLADYSNATFSTTEARIAFASSIDLRTNLLQIVLQVMLTRELMIRFGPAPVLALDGLVKALALLGMLVYGAPWIVVVAVVTRASAYGVFKPAADSLYTMVDAETRYKAKNFIDTSVWRFGDLAVTSAFNALRFVGVTLPGFVLLTVIAAASSAMVGWRINRQPELQGPARVEAS